MDRPIIRSMEDWDHWKFHQGERRERRQGCRPLAARQQGVAISPNSTQYVYEIQHPRLGSSLFLSRAQTCDVGVKYTAKTLGIQEVIYYTP